jgi:hypothetical protein
MVVDSINGKKIQVIQGKINGMTLRDLIIKESLKVMKFFEFGLNWQYLDQTKALP